MLPLQKRILMCGGPYHMASMDSGGGRVAEAMNGRFRFLFGPTQHHEQERDQSGRTQYRCVTRRYSVEPFAGS